MAMAVEDQCDTSGRLDIEAIRSLLPHRYPFLLVDRILELEPGKRAVGLKNITINEEFFQGHFPGCAITPAVIIIEAMAQVGGILLLSMVENRGKLALFAGIDKTRFRQPVVPGDTLVTEVAMLDARGFRGRIKAVGRVNGKVVADGEMMFCLVDHPGQGANGPEGTKG
jgi:3-hydroxyacyl-[acyl-carrier-protein] dehydratase